MQLRGRCWGLLLLLTAGTLGHAADARVASNLASCSGRRRPTAVLNHAAHHLLVATGPADGRPGSCFDAPPSQLPVQLPVAYTLARGLHRPLSLVTGNRATQPAQCLSSATWRSAVWPSSTLARTTASWWSSPMWWTRTGCVRRAACGLGWRGTAPPSHRRPQLGGCARCWRGGVASGLAAAQARFRPGGRLRRRATAPAAVAEQQRALLGCKQQRSSAGAQACEPGETRGSCTCWRASSQRSKQRQQQRAQQQQQQRERRGAASAWSSSCRGGSGGAAHASSAATAAAAAAERSCMGGIGSASVALSWSVRNSRSSVGTDAAAAATAAPRQRLQELGDCSSSRVVSS